MSGAETRDPKTEPVSRGVALRRALVAKLPVPDVQSDAGGVLAVDATALDLGADEIVEPLEKLERLTQGMPR